MGPYGETKPEEDRQRWGARVACPRCGQQVVRFGNGRINQSHLNSKKCRDNTIDKGEDELDAPTA
jgi:hypothetical protein